MTLGPEDLRRSPNALAADYARFGVAERLLLSGHSHQAWPDVAREGQLEAFDDAALAVDDKWERAFAKADELRAGVGALLGEPGAEVALGQNTHELVLRFLSALDLGARPRLVTTDGEFHTLRRQLARLGEAGLDVVRVPAAPVDTLAERVAAAADDRTAAVLAAYARDGEAAQVTERMVDLDEGVQEWRYRHVKMVERTIGDKAGTGGSSGAEYLRTTLFRPMFPDLWAVRSAL